MRKLLFILVVALTSLGTTAFAGTKTSSTSTKSIAGIEIPVNLVVKQTITFDSGETINVYYKKEGEVCKLYSTADLSKYSKKDLNRIKSTNFERVSKAEGKCYATETTKGLLSLAKSLL